MVHILGKDSHGVTPGEPVVRLELNGSIPFFCPQSMARYCAEIFEGEYAITWPIQYTKAVVPQLPKNPVVLDIGAGIGAFAIWSHLAYEPSQIHAYCQEARELDWIIKNADGLRDMRIEAKVANLETLSPSHKAHIVKISVIGTSPLAILGQLDLEETQVICVHVVADEQAVSRLLKLEVPNRHLGGWIGEDFELFSGYIRDPGNATLRFRRIHKADPNAS